MNTHVQQRRAAPGRCWWPSLFVAGLFAVAVAMAVDPALAQGQPTEAAVKAAYLYKFLAYVKWPAPALPAADSALVVGVAGAEDVYTELQGLIAGRRVDGRAVEARRVRENDSVAGLQVLFVGASARNPQALKTWLPKLRGQPVLVVTDVPDGLDRGAMLSLALSDGRIRFDASPAAAEQAGLRLSARLLAVADRVVGP